MRAVARLLLLAAAIVPALARVGGAPARPACAPEGRGRPPHHWLGCATDPGPPRDLTEEERYVVGLPIDPNRSGEATLALVPGIGEALAREVVADRARSGPFGAVEDLLRVRGIGPARLARARPSLGVRPPPDGVAVGGDRR